MTPELSLYENMRVNNMTNLMEGEKNIESIQRWEGYLDKVVKDYSIENIVIYRFIDNKYYESNNMEDYITHINDVSIQEFIDKHNSI